MEVLTAFRSLLLATAALAPHVFTSYISYSHQNRLSPYQYDKGSDRFFEPFEYRTPMSNVQSYPKLNTPLTPNLNSGLNPGFNSVLSPNFNPGLIPGLSLNFNPGYNPGLNPYVYNLLAQLTQPMAFAGRRREMGLGDIDKIYRSGLALGRKSSTTRSGRDHLNRGLGDFDEIDHSGLALGGQSSIRRNGKYNSNSWLQSSDAESQEEFSDIHDDTYNEQDSLFTPQVFEIAETANDF